MSVGTKIRRLRLQNKWSQEELAHKLNVAQTSVSNFESNKTIPDFLVMQKVCEVFEVGFEYFVEEKEISINFKKVKITLIVILVVKLKQYITIFLKAF